MSFTTSDQTISTTMATIDDGGNLIVPADRETEMPVANLLELTEHDWILIHRDKDGRKEIVARGKF